MKISDLRIAESPSHVDLRDYDTRSKAGLSGKKESKAILKRNVDRLAELHDVFAAQERHGLLIVLQGMDSAGKDGIIRHVMSGMNPQGVNVYGFRKPTDNERRHPFLWRETKAVPARGRIAIFNRSYYEEVLIVRVQPELLRDEAAHDGRHVWKERYEDINTFERHLTRCNTIVLKFFLHISKGEQCKRLFDRVKTPDKMWKASDADLEAHARWGEYAKAYEQMLRHTGTPWAPWYVVPSDRKWVARAVVGTIVVEALESLDLRYPSPSKERRRRLAELAEQLQAEAGR